MAADKPFPFRKPGESQDEAAERISKELEEDGERGGATEPNGEKAADSEDPNGDQ